MCGKFEGERHEQVFVSKRCLRSIDSGESIGTCYNSIGPSLMEVVSRQAGIVFFNFRGKPRRATRIAKVGCILQKIYRTTIHFLVGVAAKHRHPSKCLPKNTAFLGRLWQKSSSGIL